MDIRYCILFCLMSVINNTYGYVKRDTEQATSSSNVLDSLQRNVDRFRNCLDQALAGAVSEVNEKQLQPVFNVLGDQLNRFSKVFEILSAPQSTPP